MRIDHRYMAKIMIVMLSTNTTTRELKPMQGIFKKIYKNNIFIFFFIFTGFEPAPPGYSSLLNALDWLT